MNIKRDLKHNNQLLDLIKSYLDLQRASDINLHIICYFE